MDEKWFQHPYVQTARMVAPAMGAVFGVGYGVATVMPTLRKKERRVVDHSAHPLKHAKYSHPQSGYKTRNPHYIDKYLKAKRFKYSTKYDHIALPSNIPGESIDQDFLTPQRIKRPVNVMGRGLGIARGAIPPADNNISYHILMPKKWKRSKRTRSRTGRKKKTRRTKARRSGSRRASVSAKTVRRIVKTAIKKRIQPLRHLSSYAGQLDTTNVNRVHYGSFTIGRLDNTKTILNDSFHVLDYDTSFAVRKITDIHSAYANKKFLIKQKAVMHLRNNHTVPCFLNYYILKHKKDHVANPIDLLGQAFDSSDVDGAINNNDPRYYPRHAKAFWEFFKLVRKGRVYLNCGQSTNIGWSTPKWVYSTEHDEDTVIYSKRGTVTLLIRIMGDLLHRQTPEAEDGNVCPGRAILDHTWSFETMTWPQEPLTQVNGFTTIESDVINDDAGTWTQIGNDIESNTIVEA